MDDEPDLVKVGQLPEYRKGMAEALSRTLLF